MRIALLSVLRRRSRNGVGPDTATGEALKRTRPHEAVHVRQYERWGRGGHSYHDNPFERGLP